MQTFLINPYNRYDKDIFLDGDVRILVDNDDVDPVDAQNTAALIHVSPEMLDLCYDFVLKCHMGLARSNETYGKMKAILDEYHLHAGTHEEDED